jgi:hypothetical protein
MTNTALQTPRLGNNGYLYRNTGTYGTPTWTVMTNVKDVKVPHSFAEDDVSARITGGFEAAVLTLNKVSLSFTMFEDDGVDITAIRTAYFAKSVIEFLVINGPTTDTAARGVRMFGQIKKFDESQDNTKANTREVEIGLTWPSTDAVTAGAGSAAPFPS